MALSELNLQYKAPLRAGDVFYITTAVAQVSRREGTVSLASAWSIYSMPKAPGTMTPVQAAVVLT